MLHLLRDIPVWYRVVFVLFMIFGIASSVYTFSKCGAKALLLGNGGLYAAVSGMCDQ
jgi:hypothetical protein